MPVLKPLLKPFALLLFSIFITAQTVVSQTLKELDASRVMLPNGWKLTPVGKTTGLGDLPLNMAVSPSGKLLAVTNNGQSTQYIQLIDTETLATTDSVGIAKGWVGLTFSADGKHLYASGGNDNWIMRYSVSGSRLAPLDTFVLGKPWPVRISVAGIAVDNAGKYLYAVTKEDNSLYIIDIARKSVSGKIALGGEGYTCLLSPDNRTLYATCWGCNKVLVFDTRKQEVSGWVPVGDNPNDMCLTGNGKTLFVCNANDNSVSVVSTEKNRVVEVLNSALFPNAPTGSTTNGVALSADGKRLYIANADNNCLAVFDVSRPGFSVSKGFIPTGWYPTSVKVIKNKVFVANGKGMGSKANPLGPSPMSKREEVARHGDIKNRKVQYIGGLFTGTLQAFQEPDAAKLSVWSGAVYANTPYNKEVESETSGEPGNPIPRRVGDASPIKYVFYLIKENRTYDQVLGDMPGGNGDTSLVLFGEKVTPNHHKLAREFVLLDNFYVNGEVSADGHNWTMGAYATDYNEKNWPTSYGSRGGSYPGEGEREIANNRDGFLWDFCKRYGVTYRSYGEFIGDNQKPNLPVLEGHFCPEYIGWDMSIRDTVRFRWWKNDFEKLLAAGNVPRFSSLRFGNDHTEGLRLGRPSPKAHVAENDLAIGMFVETLSHSPIWNECAIFIVEDDAQNGPDHVDAHRTTAYVAGGFVKQGYIDHTMYSTSSMLRTMELILGLPPMSQYDAAAEPMWRCFNTVANHPPFKSVINSYDINEKNTLETVWSKMSEKFNFAKEDRIDDTQFNKVIWAAVKGDDIPCPPSVRAAFFTQGTDEDDD